MTKAELIRFLEPFDDDISVIVRNGYEWREVLGPLYAMSADGDGMAALVLGDRAIPPKLVTTSSDGVNYAPNS